MIKRMLIICLFAISILAKDKSSSKNSENAIIINDYTSVVVKNNNMEFWSKKSILIKNKKGLEFCSVSVVENEFIEVEEITAVIKDTNGIILKELETDDIKEVSISPGYVFYSGNNYKYFEFEHHTFPFIIEYSYKTMSNSLFFWKDWHPQDVVKTLKSEYSLVVAKDVIFSMEKIGEIPTPTITETANFKTYLWTLENIEEYKDEDYLPPENSTQIAIKFAPKNFEIDDYNGSFENWNEYAKFYREMSKDKYVLPPKAKEEIKNITANIKDSTEMVEALYKYLQTTTRYVAIEPGINGWQPHSATDVYQNKYGDCKDLSTYMVAMLNVAGIKAYPALARTNSLGKYNSNFVNNIFNHCITYVPLTQDTIWLECTSSYSEVGNIPYSIEDISVLVVKDSSAEFLTTPQKKSFQNFGKSKMSSALSINGDLRFLAKLNVGGNQKEHMKNMFVTSSAKDNLLYVKSRYGKYAPNLQVNNFKTSDENPDYYTLEFTGYYKKFAKMSGNKIFINPNIINQIEKSDIPEESVDERKFPIYYIYPFRDVDTLEIKIPQDYVLESELKDEIFETPFAYYKSSIKFSNNTLIYIREMEIKNNRIELKYFEDYKNFLSNVVDSDRKKIIFNKP